MRRIMVAGNWKLNGSREFTRALIDDIVSGLPAGNQADLLVCPPYVYLDAAAAMLAGTGIALGAQTVSQHDRGAFTGEVAAAMLADIGCDYVIVGHSERRALFGDTDAIVAARFAAALGAGLIPVLCVGETLEEREAGKTEAVVARQLGAVLEAAGVAAFASAIVAYEPVWAIGTGRTASPEQAGDVHRHIRGIISAQDAKIASSLRILYGGSVNGANAAQLFRMPDIDGGLIGGASLKSDDFLAICAAAGSPAP